MQLMKATRTIRLTVSFPADEAPIFPGYGNNPGARHETLDVTYSDETPGSIRIDGTGLALNKDGKVGKRISRLYATHLRDVPQPQRQQITDALREHVADAGMDLKAFDTATTKGL